MEGYIGLYRALKNINFINRADLSTAPGDYTGFTKFSILVCGFQRRCRNHRGRHVWGHTCLIRVNMHTRFLTTANVSLQVLFSFALVLHRLNQFLCRLGLIGFTRFHIGFIWVLWFYTFVVKVVLLGGITLGLANFIAKIKQ